MTGDPLDKFLHRAESGPDLICIQETDRHLTYSEFTDLVCRYAFSFAQTGEHPKVLIHLPQSADAYAAMFATLMAGGFYACSNTEWPPDRQARVAGLFRPDVVVSDQPGAVADLGCPPSSKIVHSTKLPNKRLEAPKPPHDLAYVMFTSGSTGVPKGVMVPRSGLAHYTDWAQDAMDLTPEDRWSQHPNIAFDLSVLDIYGALCSGASLHPMTGTMDRMFPATFIRDRSLTIWNSVPSVLDMMRSAQQMTPEHLGSLRMFTFCGEPLYREQVQAIFDARPDATVHNTYGPTEATVSCTLLKLTPENLDAASGQCMAFGDPIPGMDLHFMKDGVEGDEGEIVLSGPQLARGYWEAPDITADVFNELEIGGHPFPCYRTGDWGRRENGHHFFIQRIDHQIKIRGYRVELGEIDKVARELGARAACTVFADNALHCSVEGADKLDVNAIRDGMIRTLPEYAVPSVIRQLESLPRNANEKIDASALAKRVTDEPNATD